MLKTRFAALLRLAAPQPKTPVQPDPKGSTGYHSGSTEHYLEW